MIAGTPWASSLAIAVSLASLLMLGSWNDLSRLQAAGLAATPQGRVLFLGTLINIAAIAAVLLAGRLGAERLGGRWPVAARCLLLLLVMTPIDQLDSHIRLRAVNKLGEPAYLAGFWTGLFTPLVGIVLLAVRGQDWIYQAYRLLVLIVFPVTPLLLIDAGRAVAGNPPAIPAPAGPLSSAGPTTRLVWVVFDELDYAAAFSQRPTGIEMPEFDRLRGESFFALKASPPAMYTKEAMPSYLLGRKVADFDRVSPTFEAKLASGATVYLNRQPTILTEARRAGVNTYLAGWWVPYCAMFSQDLTDCKEADGATIRPSSLAPTLRGTWELFFVEYWLTKFIESDSKIRERNVGFDRRRYHRLSHEYLLKESLDMVTGPGGRFVLLHLPIPHPMGIWDRHENRLTYSTRSNTIDNLELADRTLGELRRAMERVGVWDGTTLIVTSDHPLRKEVWSSYWTWTDEEQQIVDGRKGDFIPVLVKPAQTSRRLEWPGAFNTLSLTSLSAAILKGQIRTVEDVARFLDSPEAAAR